MKLRSKEVTGSGAISASLPRLTILGFLLAFSFVLVLSCIPTMHSEEEATNGSHSAGFH